MSDIPYTVRQASSGDAKGLVRSQQWITNEPVKKAFVLLALDEPCTIKQIQGRNHCAAFIEAKVANNVDKYDESDFTEFLPMQTLRTSSQISSDQRKEEKFSFEKQLSWKHAQRKWNRIAILLENPFNPMIKLGLLNLTIIGSSGAEFELKGATLDVPLLDNDEMDRSLDEDSKDVELEMNRKERRGEIRSQSASSSQNDNMPAPSPKKSTKSSQEDKKPKMPTSKFVSLDFSSEDEEPPVKSTKKESSQKDSQKSDKKEKKKEKKEEETKVEKKKPAKDVPYKELLQGVTLVISGIENPERAIIRETALKMGAQYRPQWCKEATHCVAVALNTPKMQEVAKDKKAQIVNRDWVKACHDAKQRLDESDYSLVVRRGTKRARDSFIDDDESEEEDPFPDDKSDDTEGGDVEDGYDPEEQRLPDDDYEPDEPDLKRARGSDGKRRTKSRSAKRDFKDVYGILDSDSEDEAPKPKPKEKTKTITKGFADLDDVDISPIPASPDAPKQQEKSLERAIAEKKKPPTPKKSPVRPKAPPMEESDRNEIERLLKYHSTTSDELPSGGFVGFITEVFNKAVSYVQNDQPHDFFANWEFDIGAPKAIRQILRKAVDDNKDEIISELNKTRDTYTNYIQYLSIRASQDKSQDTEEEEETVSKQRSERVERAVVGPNDNRKLKDLFSGLRIFIDTKMSDKDRRMLKRQIIAFDGDVDEKCENGVTTHVIVASDERGQKYLSEKRYKVLDKNWVSGSCSKQKRLPEEAFIIEQY